MMALVVALALLAVAVPTATTGTAPWKCPCESWGCQPACPCACPCPCADQTLCAPLGAAAVRHGHRDAPVAARREVLAFHAHLYNESGRTGAQNFDHYPWDQLTTVAIYTGVGNSSNGTDSVLLTCTAHSHGVRVTLGQGGQWTVGPWTVANLNTSTKRKALAKQYIDSAVLYGLDGLDLDVEYDGTLRNASWYAERAKLLTLFTCEMRFEVATLLRLRSGRPYLRARV
jgi:hypothetical protein